MKKLTTLVALLLTLSVAHAKPTQLRFNRDGEFKIAQFTDTHINVDLEASDNSIALFEELIENECPDLAVFTGDIVVDVSVFKGWELAIEPFRKAGIPVAIVLGNHDDEGDQTRDAIYDFLKKQDGCFSNKNDYSLTVTGRDGSAQSILYFFDSNAYSTLDGVDGYGWITHEQVSKYRDVSKKYRKVNKGVALPALAFFHIALPEYRESYRNPEMPPFGVRGEDECGPEINTGLFASMLEAGDVMGCFVGHDHDNDYISCLYNIALAYGRCSSRGTTYGEQEIGSRIIILHEGERRFDSYIYVKGGNIEQKSTFPRQLRFAVTADTHFDMPPESDQWRNVMELNRHNLDGVAIVGDLFDHQHPDILELFRRRYDNRNQIDGDSTLRAQLYVGLGNHDINPEPEDNELNRWQRNITVGYVDSLLREMKSAGKIKKVHEPTRCYSFDLNGLHFIQTHTWAGDTTLGEGGLEWLAKDLKRYGSKGEPIVLLMHYDFDPESGYWISFEGRDQLAAILKGYNVKAIFSGHDHNVFEGEWEGIPIYTADNVWVDSKDELPSFWIITYSEYDGFKVERTYWQE